MNLSKTVDAFLQEEVKRRYWEKWRDDNREAFDAFLLSARPNTRVSQPVPDDELQEYVQRGGGKILLTDDHAPVDNMIAPLFTYRFG